MDKKFSNCITNSAKHEATKTSKLSEVIYDES